MPTKLLTLAALVAALCACKRQAAVGQGTSSASAAGQPAIMASATPGTTSPLPSEPKPAERAASPVQSQTASSVTAATTSDQDVPLSVGQETFHFVKHVYHCPTPSKEQSVDWWELRDSGGKAVYHQDYKTEANCAETVDVGAEALNGQQGHGILIDGEDLPSAPDSGGWVQVFGMQNGKLAPFGKPFSGGGEYAGFTTQSKSGKSVGGGMLTVSKDVLTFKQWTGNFHMVYPLAIDWANGTVSPAWHCLSRNSKFIMVDACSFPVEATAQSRQQMTFVRLFPEPDAGTSPKHAVIKPESKVEFLEATEPVVWQGGATTPVGSDSPHEVWLKIRVDGQEGWIHEQEDFEAVGLPFAG